MSTTLAGDSKAQFAKRVADGLRWVTAYEITERLLELVSGVKLGDQEVIPGSVTDPAGERLAYIVETMSIGGRAPYEVMNPAEYGDFLCSLSEDKDPVPGAMVIADNMGRTRNVSEVAAGILAQMEKGIRDENQGWDDANNCWYKRPATLDDVTDLASGEGALAMYRTDWLILDQVRVAKSVAGHPRTAL